MASIATLAVSITARTKKFQKGLRGARASLKRFSASVKAISLQTIKFGSVLSGAALAGATILTKKAFDSIDAIAKLSDSIGVTTEDLAGFQLAAEITGVSVEAMNKSLGKMVKGIGEAKTGLGTAKLTFDQLGLSADELAKDGGTVAFGKIADAINKLPTAADRANASYQIFGRTGIALTNTLAVGSEGIAAFRKEAELLGLTVSRVDAAKIEAANDSMTRLGKLTTGLARQFSVKLAPFIELASKRIIAFSTAGGNATKRVQAGMAAILKVVGRAADVLKVFEAGFFALKGTAELAMLGVGFAIETAIRSAESLLSLVGITSTAAGDFVHDLNQGMADQVTESFDKSKQAMISALDNETSKAISRFIQETQREAEIAGKAIEEKVTNNLKKSVDVVQELGKGMKSLARRITDSLKTPLDKFKDQLNDINDVFAAGLISGAQRAAAIVNLKSKFSTKDAIASTASSIGARSINPNLVNTNFSNRTKKVQNVTDPENKKISAKMDELIRTIQIGGVMASAG